MRRTRMVRWAGAALLVAGALGAGGCATTRSSAHIDAHVDFTRFKTFAWGPADALPAGDPRLDASGFFQDHMQGAVERQMRQKGYEHVGALEAADVQIHFHAVIRERLNVAVFDTRRGYCSASDCGEGVAEFEEGTLVVDVMDARTNRLVWRGWAQDGIGDALENRDRLAQRIDQAVKSLMGTLPPHR